MKTVFKGTEKSEIEVNRLELKIWIILGKPKKKVPGKLYILATIVLEKYTFSQRATSCMNSILILVRVLLLRVDSTRSSTRSNFCYAILHSE